ncbi:hypothetical protein [Sphaerisporangium aureirubrum]|uniref:Lipoprotein n=1 Tax=Sphaerisporangium aureirubrum TaxID=1544736 RepID=A0ABW1NF46_9ACTN
MTRPRTLTRRTVTRSTRAALALAAGILIAVSCSPGTPPGDPYAGDLERARKQAVSDFEKQVLADREITRPEYDEAVRRYVSCMKAHGLGFEAVLGDYGYYTYVETPSSPRHDAIHLVCRRGTTFLIESLYTEIITNPGHRDLDELRAACFVRKGLAPKDYSGDSSKADGRRGYEGAPFDKEDPRFQQCLANPSM